MLSNFAIRRMSVGVGDMYCIEPGGHARRVKVVLVACVAQNGENARLFFPKYTEVQNGRFHSDVFAVYVRVVSCFTKYETEDAVHVTRARHGANDERRSR